MEAFKKIGKVVIPMVLVLMPFLVFAQGLPNPQAPVGGRAIDLQEIENLIDTIAQFLIVVGVVIAVIFIIIGGILWISGGGGDTTAKGKAYVKNGIYGAAIILGVGVILQTLAGLVTRTFFN